MGWRRKLKVSNSIFYFILLFMSAVFIGALPAFCASPAYYIDCNAINASDSGSGTRSQPWKSLASLKNRNFSPGDTLYFAKGSSYAGGVTIDFSGTASAPITITSYGSGNAPGFSNSDHHNQNGNVFQIKGDYIIIDGLYFHDGAESADAQAASVLKIGDVYIDRGADHVTVEDCEFFNSPVGIHTNGEYTLITHNNFHDCNRALAFPGWGPIAVILANANSEISYNQCTNYILPGGEYGADGGFLEVDPRCYGQPVTGLKIHHNYSYGNEGFLEIEGSESGNGGVTVSYNFSNDYQEFIFFWSSRNCLVENNTILRVLPKNSVTDVVFSFRYGGNIIRNNIFIVNGGKRVFSNNGTETWGFGANYPGQIHNNNLYYSIDGSASDPIGLPAGSGEKVLDPKFVNYPADCRLRSDSPAINAAISLGYTKDFDDNHVPSGGKPDIGAFEYQGPLQYDTTSADPDLR
jgi:hypothetical protein